MHQSVASFPRHIPILERRREPLLLERGAVESQGQKPSNLLAGTGAIDFAARSPAGDWRGEAVTLNSGMESPPWLGVRPSPSPHTAAHRRWEMPGMTDGAKTEGGDCSETEDQSYWHRMKCLGINLEALVVDRRRTA